MRSFADKLRATQQAKSPDAKLSAPSRLRPVQGVNWTVNLQYASGSQPAQSSLQTNAEESNTGLAGATSPHLAYDFSRIPLHPPTGLALQERLSISAPDDEYEKEADRVAGQVMRTPELRLQRKSISSETGPGCQQEQPGRYPETSLVKHVQAIDTKETTAPPIIKQALAASGRPLDATARAFMEPRFGHNFVDVRVHTDMWAAESSRSINAAAYTLGKHIVFGAGQYRPDTLGGRALLAHELAHVSQQSISKPILQRAPIPGWNFTPSDFSKLQSARKDLTIARDSSWFPAKLQTNLLNTLRFLLGPTVSPKATEGVNVLDFFHGHLVVNRKDLLVDWEGKERPPEQAMKHAQEFEVQEKSAAAKTLGGSFTQTRLGPSLSFRGRYPVNARNLPAFTAAIEKLLPAFGNVLEEGSKVPGAAVMYHTFEFTTPSDLAAKGQKLSPENPRRHYVTPLDTNTPRQYTPPPVGYEKEYIVIAPFSFLVDTNGAVHVRPFAASAGSGFTSLELSTVTGTPFAGEPFPVP